MSYYIPEYFKVYPTENQIFSAINGVAAFVCGVTTNIISGVIMIKFDKYHMTKPLLCLFKSVVDIPCLCMIYLQQGSFIVSVVGLICQYTFGKGWSGPAISMLQTVVPPQIKGTAVAMFMFFSAILSSFTSIIIGGVTTSFNLSPEDTPRQYGLVIALMVISPSIISIPFFYLAGR